MKTAAEIIAYMEAELAEAYELHDQAKGKDAQAALYQLIRATTILNLLEEIKAPEEAQVEDNAPGEDEEKKKVYAKILLDLYLNDLITKEELYEKLNQ